MHTKPCSKQAAGCMTVSWELVVIRLQHQTALVATNAKNCQLQTRLIAMTLAYVKYATVENTNKICWAIPFLARYVIIRENAHHAKERNKLSIQ